MNLDYKQILLWVTLFIFWTKVFGYQKDTQENDKKNQYRALRGKIYQVLEDSSKRDVKTAYQYLNLARANKDSLLVADAYYYLARTPDTDKAHTYNDSVILFSKNLNNNMYPFLAYEEKAKMYYHAFNYKKAFDYYLKSTEEAKKYNKELEYHEGLRRMVMLKVFVGEYESSIVNLKKCYAYFSQTKDEMPMNYLYTIHLLSDAYTNLKQLDSASAINRIGYKDSDILGVPDFKSEFVFLEGINQYEKGNYQAAKDSLQKSIPEMAKGKAPEDIANESIAYFYLGKTLSALGNHKEALVAHKKVDEIYGKSRMAIPQIRYSYDVLINHYKDKGDRDNHLKYIERRLSIDSMLTSDYRYLIKNVVQKYDTPRLLSEKQEIIDSLENENKFSNYIIIVLVIVSVLFLCFWVYNYFKRRDYKRKFDLLYNSTAIEADKGTEPIISVMEDGNDIGITKEIIEDVLEKLEKFEQNFGFLKPDITTNSLSKRFNTNYKYLSKIVNRYKNKGFSAYINDLRIEYSVQKLKEDKKFKNYTMQAIANEVGFNTSQAFSKSFFKKNGIHPSYFVKELHKKEIH